MWQNRRVLVTGHTGFKGGWLSLWLAARGAHVHGFALDPPTTPSFHDACGVAGIASRPLCDGGFAEPHVRWAFVSEDGLGVAVA